MYSPMAPASSEVSRQPRESSRRIESEASAPPRYTPDE